MCYCVYLPGGRYWQYPDELTSTFVWNVASNLSSALLETKDPQTKSLVCVLITASFCTALILTRGKRPCHRWKCTTLRLYWDKQVYKARAAWVRSQPCVNQGYLRRHKTAEDDTVSDGVSHESRERRLVSRSQLSEANSSFSPHPRHTETRWALLHSRKQCMLGNHIF